MTGASDGVEIWRIGAVGTMMVLNVGRISVKTGGRFRVAAGGISSVNVSMTLEGGDGNVGTGSVGRLGVEDAVNGGAPRVLSAGDAPSVDVGSGVDGLEL